MKKITELSGTDFLRQCNKIRHGVDEVLINTQVLELRKRMPVMNEDDTLEDRKRKLDEQSKKNINDMLDLMLEEMPEETLKLFHLLIIMEDGDKEPSGMEMLLIGMEILSDKRVLDFLASLMRLGQMSTEGR